MEKSFGSMLVWAIASSVWWITLAVVFIALTGEQLFGLGFALGAVSSASHRVLAAYLVQRQLRKQALRDALAQG